MPLSVKITATKKEVKLLFWPQQHTKHVFNFLGKLSSGPDDPFYVVYATESNHTRLSSARILIPPPQSSQSS